MKKPSDSICKLSKSQLKTHFNLLLEEALEPKYVCKKCARVSRIKKRLCSARKLS